MDYGQKIKYVREKIREISLTELHKRTGLSLSYLSDAENGKCNMSTKALEKVAKALDVDAWYLMNPSAISFQELARISNYEPPPDILEFVTNQEKLPYILLAKKMSEDGISPEAWEVLIDNIKQLTKPNK